ncbi:glycosyltransferase [Chloroflexota bacterium]
MWHIYQGLITLCLAMFMVNLILNLRALHKLGNGKKELPVPLPLISVLVPARNEESDIVTCLESLRKQDYPNYEVLVLDDNSSDSTADIIDRISAIDPRVRLLRGKSLPDGWTGKSYACHQLASKARGSWLLFTDADTVHAPGMLSSALSYTLNNKVALLSGFPLQHTASFSQKVVVPAMYFFTLSWFPLWWLQGSRRPRPGLAIGQFIFVSAADYYEIGGHEAVKAYIMEDVWLGFKMVHHGKRQGVVDLSQVVACRTYDGVGDLWEGFTKWMYSVASFSPLAFGSVMLGGLVFFVVPFILMAGHFSPVLDGYGWFVLLVMQVVIILLMRVLFDHRFHYSPIYALFHPAGVSFMLLSSTYGGIRRFTHAGVNWKQRLYTPVSGIK